MGFKDEMAQLPQPMKDEGGQALYYVQLGEDPPDSKHMTSIGSGAKEIRLQDANGWYRIFYVAKFPDAIYILGIIQKKTNSTSQHDIENAKKVYRAAEVKSKKKTEEAAKLIATGNQDAKNSRKKA